MTLAAPPPAVNVFVAADGNAFMTDIATWLVDAARCGGRDARLVTDRLPTSDGAVNLVVAPHEFYVLRHDDDRAVRAAARCSIPICTEQPGTPWFKLAVGLCAGSPLVVDINEVGADALRLEGFDVRRLQLGATPAMIHEGANGPERDVDVLFLGGSTPRRDRVLAGLASVLWDRNAEIRTFTFSRPVSGGEPGLVFGPDKYELLARSKMLVNLHRGDAAGADDEVEYFEWARMVEAMANGCLVVSEASVGHEPLVAGEHFVESSVEALAETIESMLADDSQRREITETARSAVVDLLGLEHAVAELLAVADPIALSNAPAPSDAASWWRRKRQPANRPVVRSAPPPLLPVFAPYRSLRRDVYDQLLAEIAHRRELGRFRSLLEHDDPDHVTITSTRAWDDAADHGRLEVSVVVTVFDYADVVVETLDSIVGSRDVATEIVIVDDASTDDSIAVVRDWMEQHPEVAVLLIQRAANQGLTRARNLAIERVRADLVMIMDADNLVYPSCLRRLADSLSRDPGASFAYSTLEAFGAHPGLRSAQGWYVPWLCDANYIDAQALFRKSALERFGGYRVDDTMYGWEDWDLWLRLADAGEYGVHVPQMLGRYRTQGGSMVSLTNLAAADLRTDLVARYPELPWPDADAELLR